MKTNKITLPTIIFKSLNSFVAKVKEKIPRKQTQGFVEPSGEKLQIFYDAINALLRNDLNTAQALAASANYDLAQLNDRNVKRIYLVLVEKAARFHGLGTYIFDLNFQRNLIVEVPHPLADEKTIEEGAAIFQGTNARALFIAGTHRCANKKASPCSGQTTVCNNGISDSFKISDAGHYTTTFFQKAHHATLGVSAKPVAISLHGKNFSLPEIILSDGTSNAAAANSLVNRLRGELKNLGASVGSCNFPQDGNLNLCGTTNVQGRLSNGSNNACRTNAAAASGLFLHVEQNLKVRKDPTKLINALKLVISAKK